MIIAHVCRELPVKSAFYILYPIFASQRIRKIDGTACLPILQMAKLGLTEIH